MASPVATPIVQLPAERFFRTAHFLLILTSVLTLASTGKLDTVTTVLVPALVVYKGYRGSRGYAAELAPSTATWLVVGYLFLFPVDMLIVSKELASGTSNPGLYAALLAAVHFLLFVTIVRLYSATTDRDSLFLSMLSFAGILAAAIFTVDTIFLGFFLVFLLFGVASFVGLEIRRGAAGAVSPPVYRQAGGERRFDRALGLASLSVGIGAVCFGFLLFFLFPRFSAGYFARTGLQPALMSGFTDNVELGQIGEIKKDNSVVMRVKTETAVNYPLLRWRGIALTNFDGRRWTNAERFRAAHPPQPDGWIPLIDRRELEGQTSAELRFTVLLQPVASDALFAPAHLLMLRGNFSGEAGTYYVTARSSYLQSDFTDSVFNPARNFSQIRYEGVSLLPVARPAEARTAGTDYPEDIRDTYLQLPKLDPRIPEFARRITAKANTPYDRALVMEEYLRRNFAYTLNLSGKLGQDPLAHFLFETKAGHCEYFASAMAVMLRSLGIPSREVNGFLPGEFNDLGGDYIVRASDAHSWVEAYFPGTGWLTFDPTPSAPDAGTGLFSRFGMYLDWFQLSWNEWIINYDFSHQLTMAKNMRQNSTDWTVAARNKFRKLRDRGMRGLTEWQRGHAKLRLLFPAALVLLLVVLRFDWIRKLFQWAGLEWESKRPSTKRSNPLLASRLYAELLRLLEKRGYRRAESQTAREFAASQKLQAELIPAVREFTDLYAQARFGGVPCDALRLRALLEQVRSAPRHR